MDRAIDPRPQLKKRRMVAFAAIIVALSVVFGLGSSLGRSRIRVERDRLSIGLVQEGIFKEFIPVTGNVLPIKTVFLDAVQGGVVEEVFLEDGHAIEAGTPILRL